MAFLGKWGSVLRNFIDENQTLGGRLQNARARQGLSISDFAKLSGVQKKTLMNWELDRSEPRSNRLIQLAGVLGVQATYLLNGQRGDIPLPQRSKDGVKAVLADLEAKAETLARDVLRIGEEIQQLVNQITRLRQSDW
jgi:transcriptional regulator with XRE-family HTH domain